MVNSDFVNSRPQRLCRCCGRCCRVATTSIPYEELKHRCANNEQEAIDFLEIFEPYPSIEAAKTADKEIVENIINRLKNDGRDYSNLTFYRCKYIQDNNLCGIYDERKNLCKIFPNSPWAVVPPGCGFEGWLFLKREEVKQRIRKLKENQLYFRLKLQHASDSEQIKALKDAIKSIDDIVMQYEVFGASDW